MLVDKHHDTDLEIDLYSVDAHQNHPEVEAWEHQQQEVQQEEHLYSVHQFAYLEILLSEQQVKVVYRVDP